MTNVDKTRRNKTMHKKVLNHFIKNITTDHIMKKNFNYMFFYVEITDLDHRSIWT